MPSRIYGKKEKCPLNERKKENKRGMQRKVEENKSPSVSLSFSLNFYSHRICRFVRLRSEDSRARQSSRVKLITVPIAASEIYGVHARGIQFRQKSRISNGIRLGFIGDILSNIIYRYVNETLGEGI